jgi:rod shape determining protein RodA
MKDVALTIGISILVLIGIFILHSIAGAIFPLYYLYLLLGFLFFFLFSRIDFDILSLFARHFYFGSIVFLLLPLIIGQVTRGAIRWIPLGALTIQPAEIVRPFLLVFLANYVYENSATFKNLLKTGLVASVPVFLIFIQPSLGVALVTGFGFLGVILASQFEKKYFFLFLLVILFLAPFGWQALAPYQKSRVVSFLSPGQDPSGAGYNSLQAMISVGSGGLWGRGPGEGAQTQLFFLPEKHTDFIFASIAHEMGFVGAFLVLALLFFVLWRVIKTAENAQSPQGRAFITGVFLALFIQSLIHIGMNMGLLPITGVPLPLVSAGGSSLIATMATLGMVVGARK